MSNTLSDLEYEFLEKFIRSIEGIGEKTATKILGLRDNFSEFNTLGIPDLSKIPRLGNSKKREIITKLSSLDYSRGVEYLYTKFVLEDFIKRQFEALNSLHLDDLDINVLLIKALGFTTAEETIDFYLYQWVTRSVVTSWGQKTIEEICHIAGAEPIPKGQNVGVSGKNFDLMKKCDDITYYIQIKSGPNTMSIGMVDSLNDMIARIEEENTSVFGILGMTYGEKSQISSQISRKLNDFEERAKIGKEFWELLSGDPEYYQQLIILVNELSEDINDEFDDSFLESVRSKKVELIQEWEDEYGARGEDGLKAFFERLLALQRNQ